MSAYDSNTPFKDITTESEGTSTTKYGSNQWRELMRMFNANTVATRLIRWVNPWRWESFFEIKASTAPGNATAGNVRIYVDTTDGKLKLKRSDGQVFSLEEQPGTSATHRAQHTVPLGQDAFIKTDILGGSSRYIESLLADPTSDAGRIWIDANDLQFWDNQTTPVMQTVEKTINKNAVNGYVGLDASTKINIAQLPSIVDSTVATHTSTKITITNKAQLNNQIAYMDATGWLTSAMVSSSRIADKTKLNANIAYKDQNNDFGSFYQDFGNITTPGSPGSGKRRLYVDNSDTHLKVKTSSGGVVDLESSATPTVNLMPDGSGPPTSGKWGAIWGGANEGTGIMAGLNIWGNWLWVPSSTTSYTEFETELADEAQAGFSTKIGVTRKDRNPQLKFGFRSQTFERYWVGFIQNWQIAPNQNRPGNNEDCILFGYGSTDNNFMVLVNDSGSTPDVYDTGIPKDSANRHIEFILDNAASRLIVNAEGVEEVNTTTGVPGNPTNGWRIINLSESVSGNPARMWMSYMQIKNDK